MRAMKISSALPPLSLDPLAYRHGSSRIRTQAVATMG